VWEDGSKIVSDASLSDSDGDGTWEVDNLFSVDVTTDYSLELTATDDDGATATYEDNQLIKDLAPEFNSSSVSPDPPLIGETADFSYSATDPDGSIQSVDLVLKDDGSTVFTGSKSTATGTFNPSYSLTQGDITAEFTATDNDGATATKTLTRTLVDNRGTLIVNSPTGSVSNPERFFDYDVPVSVTHSDNDNNPNETITLDFDFVRDGDPGFTTDQTVNITEGETFTTSFRQEISNTNEFRVSFNDQTQTYPDSNVDNFFNVTDFAVTSVSGADQAFETESRQFTVNFRTGDMINTEASASKVVYNGSGSVNPYFPNPSSTGSNTASVEVPLVQQNQTDLQYKFSLKYNATKFNGGTEIRTENSSTQKQTVLHSYFVEDTSTPPRNGDYIETENLQHVLQIHTQTKKADLTGTTTYERNQETSQMQETTVAQDLNQFKGEIDTGLANSFNKSKFNVSSNIQVSFEGDTRTLEARDEIEVYRIQITDGSTNLDTEKTLNFDINYEENGYDAKANFQADFSVWKNRDQKIRRFNFQKKPAKEHSFFIYPSWAEYNLRTLNYPNQQKFDLIQFFNEDTNKVKRSYFFPQVQTINNDTTTVPLKTINRSETRLIDFEMSNSEGDPAEDVYCRVDRKFAGGNFQTSFVFNTNSEGKAEAAAETTGTFYGLKCFKNGELIETFSAQKLQDPVRLQFGAAAETTRLNFFEKFDSACTTGTTFVNCSYQSQSEKLEKAVLEVERQEIVQDLNVCTEKGSTATGRLVCTGLNTSKEKYKFDVQAQYPDTSTQGTVGFTGTKQASIPFSGLFMTAIIFMLVTSASAYNITIGIGAGTLTMLLMSIIDFITLTPGQRATLIAVAIIAGVAIQR